MDTRVISVDITRNQTSVNNVEVSQTKEYIRYEPKTSPAEIGDR